jgi:hypothetical protein
VEVERDGLFPLLGADIYRRPDGSLGHEVYRNPTHTNLCLDNSSHHRPAHRLALLSVLVYSARALCDQGSPHEEMVFLGCVFRRND